MLNDISESISKSFFVYKLSFSLQSIDIFFERLLHRATEKAK